MAVRVQGSGIEVEVALEFDRGHLQALVLQEHGQAGGEDALAQPAHDRAEDDDVLGPPDAVPIGNGRGELGLFGLCGDVAENLGIGHPLAFQ